MSAVFTATSAAKSGSAAICRNTVKCELGADAFLDIASYFELSGYWI